MSEWLFVPLFLVLFAASWVFILTLMAKLGGWSELAHRYARPPDARPSTRFYFQSMVLRSPGMGYHGCVNIGASERGLFLSTIPPFQFAHPQLMIPWERVRSLGRRWYWLMPHDWYAFEGSSKRIGFPSWSWGARLVRRCAAAASAVISQ
jgi:hypothetical protein